MSKQSEARGREVYEQRKDEMTRAGWSPRIVERDARAAERETRAAVEWAERNSQ